MKLTLKWWQIICCSRLLQSAGETPPSLLPPPSLVPPVSHSSSPSWPLELCSPAWCLAPGAPPASTWWSSVQARWPWRAARWPPTNAKVRCTSSRPTIPSSTSAGRTEPPATWTTWVTRGGGWGVRGGRFLGVLALAVRYGQQSFNVQFFLTPPQPGFDHLPWWLRVQAGEPVHHRTSVCVEVQSWLQEAFFLDAGVWIYFF